MCRWPPKPQVRCLRPESWRESLEVEVASRLWCRTRPSSPSGFLRCRRTSPIWSRAWQIGPGAALSSRRELVETRTVLVDSRIAPANAIKNVLLGVTSLVAAAVFIATGPVLWAAVLPPAGGLFIGSALGPIIVRHLPPNLVRGRLQRSGSSSPSVSGSDRHEPMIRVSMINPAS